MAGITFNRAILRLQGTSWLKLLECAYLILIASFVARLAISDDGLDASLKAGAVYLALLLVAAKDLAHAPEAFVRLRGVRAAGQGLPGQIGALLPPGLNGWLRLEREMWRGCAAWLLRRPNLACRPPGVALHFLERGSHGAVLAIVLVAVIAEMPVSHLLAELMVTDATLLWRIHVLLGVAALYSLVWVAGERWHLAAGCHVIDGSVLDLKIGARAAARIPLDKVVAASRVSETRAAWCRSNGVDSRDTVLITPFDGPNVVLTLAPDAAVPLSLYGVERQAPRHVFLYLDRPELLLGQIGLVRAK